MSRSSRYVTNPQPVFSNPTRPMAAPHHEISSDEVMASIREEMPSLSPSKRSKLLPNL
jgi:hypothetical protein